MKLEVGMYVRVKSGEIHKIKSVTNEYVEYENGFGLPFALKDIITQASFDVVDLMKEKDLIEIEYYSQRYNKRVTRLFEITYIDDEYINFDNSKCNFMLVNKQFTNSDKELKPIFKSIITCEQREKKSYKI